MTTTEISTDLIAWCASHIECRERALYLTLMVKSWFRQVAPCKLVVSLSYEPDQEAQTTLTVKELQDKFEHLEIRVRETKLAQFEHYKLLTDEHTNQDPQWVLMSDDDDIWSPNRTAMYLNTILSINEEISFISAGNYTENSANGTVKQPLSPEQVNDLIAKKQVKVTNTPTGTSNRYVMFATQAERVRKWTHAVHDTILKHPFADLYWLRYLTESSEKFGIIEDPVSWPYFFRNWSKDKQHYARRMDMTITDPKEWAKQVVALYYCQHSKYTKQQFKQFCRGHNTNIKAIKAMQQELDKMVQDGDLRQFEALRTI